jgi:predicted DNA binding protein
VQAIRIVSPKKCVYADEPLQLSMRRIILEFAADEIAGFLRQPSLEKIDSLEVITFLKNTPEEVALICRVQFKDPATKVEDVFKDKFVEMQILEKDKRGFICYFKKRRPGEFSKVNPLDAGGYLSIPYGIADGRLKGTFLGSEKEVRRIIEGIERAGVNYKVVSLMDARFSPDSPLAGLTEKQRKVILSAFNQGYYDVPRRVSSEELARRLNIREPTLVMHRRKAERRLLAAVVRES